MPATTRSGGGTQPRPRDSDDGDAADTPGAEQGALSQEQQQQQVSAFAAAALFMAQTSPSPAAVAGRDAGPDQTSPGFAAGSRTESSLGPEQVISARQQRSPAPDAWGPRTTTGGAFGGGAFGGGTTDARRGRDAPDGRHPARGAARGRGRAPSSSFFPGSSGRYGPDTYGDGMDGYGDYGSDASERGAGPRGRGRWAPPGTYPGWGPGRQSGRGGGHPQLDGEDYRVRNAPRALKGLVREQVALGEQALDEPRSSSFWRIDKPSQLAAEVGEAPGSAAASAKLRQVIELAVEALTPAGLLLPDQRAEAQAAAFFNSVFVGPTLREWQATKDQAGGSSTDFIGPGSRLYRRLALLVHVYAPHSAREEWLSARNKFRWLGSLQETERAFKELVAQWEELARQTAHMDLAYRVPVPDENWCWEVLSQAQGTPQWVLEKSKTQSDDVRTLGLFEALRKHSSGMKHTGAAQVGGSSSAGMPRVHQLAAAGGVQSVADLASLAAAMGYGLTPLPRSEGDAYSLGDPAFDDRWEAPVLSMTGSDGRLLANNGQLIQCHICSENHFKADCPKLDVSPCYGCNGVDHTLRSCPDAPPALLRRAPRTAPTPYVRPGLGQSGRSYVTGRSSVHMLAGGAQSSVPRSDPRARDADQQRIRELELELRARDLELERQDLDRERADADARRLEISDAQRKVDEFREEEEARKRLAGAASAPPTSQPWTHQPRFVERAADGTPGNF